MPDIDITVTFWGICTIIHGEGNVESPRIALVAAREDVIKGNAHLSHSNIQPHVARVHIPTSDILTIGPLSVAYTATGDWMRFNLDYVRMRILNTTQTLEMKTSCLPHLGNLGHLAGFAVPSEETEVGGSAIACVFELTHGLLRGIRKKEHGAGLSVLTSSTDGDPVLSTTPFGTTTPSTITLRRGASIVVTNLPVAPESDDDNDFLLHYLTLSSFPSEPGVPLGDVHCPLELGADDAGLGIYVGPGCSNSNYP